MTPKLYFIEQIPYGAKNDNKKKGEIFKHQIKSPMSFKWVC